MLKPFSSTSDGPSRLPGAPKGARGCSALDLVGDPGFTGEMTDVAILLLAYIFQTNEWLIAGFWQLAAPNVVAWEIL